MLYPEIQMASLLFYNNKNLTAASNKKAGAKDPKKKSAN